MGRGGSGETVVILRSLRQRLAQLAVCRSGRYVVPYHLERPIISITFDDFPHSALDIGGSILESEGISATYYACFGLAHSDTAAGSVGRIEDLAACVVRGHEIGCHTYHHLDCCAASADEVAHSLACNQKVALDLGLPTLRSFAYPFGREGSVGKRIAMQSYRSARTIVWGVNRFHIDLSLLKSVPLYSRDGPPDLERYLDAIQSRNGWLILYTHDVSDHPSPYGCTPEKLRGVIRRAREMGASILSVGAVVNRLLEAQVVG
jgi:peptidoglycan/xylan/chitin deacetylase (PgdA/CDA1 family)